MSADEPSPVDDGFGLDPRRSDSGGKRGTRLTIALVSRGRFTLREAFSNLGWAAYGSSTYGEIYNPQR